MRSFGRFGSALSVNSLRLYNDLKFGTANAAFYYPTSSSSPSNLRRVQFTVSGDQGITGGILHGTWITDNAISTSDRRLKKNITPLNYELQKLERQKSRPGGVADNDLTHGSSIDWILRELRPVSFRFRASDDSKTLSSTNFGFVAQELEKSLPSLVRTGSDQTKYVMYQDLLALITLAVQEQQTRLNFQDAEVMQAQELVQNLLQSSEVLEEEIDRLEQR